MFDISDEFDYFFRHYFSQQVGLQSTGEFVYSDQDMFLAAWRGTKWSYSVETPHSEGP
jgi:hypothetical protein